MRDQDKLIDLLVHAENNKVGMDEMLEIRDGVKGPKGDEAGFLATLDNGIRIVLTIEQHPMGWMRHMSISKNNECPDDEETWAFSEKLGFDKEVPYFAYVENGPGIESVNIIQ